MTSRDQAVAVRRPRSDAQRNRERILEVARGVFERAGANASMDEIAREAGVGPGTLYRHFPTRDALIEAVYHTTVEKLAVAAERLSATLEPVEALRRWMLLFVDQIAAKVLIAEALNSVAGGAEKMYAGSRPQTSAAMEMLLRRAVESGQVRPEIQPQDLFQVLVGAAHMTRNPDWEQSARRMVEIVIAGARTGK